MSSDARVARARCSALFTEATLVSRSSATSVACHLSTSQRMSTARCRAGRCCRAATKASRIDSRAAATSAGSPSVLMTRLSAIGCTKVFSARGRSWAVATADDGPRSIGRARRWGARCMSMHTLLAMR